MNTRVFKWLGVSVGIIIFGWLFAMNAIRSVSQIVVDRLWFAHLGYEEVFTTQFLTSLTLGCFWFLFSLLSLYILYLHVKHRAASTLVEMSPIARRTMAGISFLTMFLIALSVGTGANSDSSVFLLAKEHASFDKIDPFLGLSYDFYVYTLPLLEKVAGHLSQLIVFSFFALGAFYALTFFLGTSNASSATKTRGTRLKKTVHSRAWLTWGIVLVALGVLSGGSGDAFFGFIIIGVSVWFFISIAQKIFNSVSSKKEGTPPSSSSELPIVNTPKLSFWEHPRSVVLHGFVPLVGCFLLIVSLESFLGIFRLIKSGSSSVLPTLSWFDHYYFVSYYGVAAGMYLLVGLFFLLRRTFSWRIHGVVLCSVIFLQFIFGNFLPSLIIRFYLKPNEPKLEESYIQAHLDATRYAYNLDAVVAFDYNPSSRFTREDIKKAKDTVDNIRIWDYRAFNMANNQLQALRTYYHFLDADTDRYVINGAIRQVEISARELDLNQIPPDANNRFIIPITYTHGDGVVLSRANAVSEDGRPEYVIRDIPASSTDPLLQISDSRIYFGEGTYDTLFVNTGIKEVNEGIEALGGGVRSLGFSFKNILRKAAVAFSGTDWVNVLFSSYLDNDTQYVAHRDIHDRVRTLAPHLKFDSDAYPVIRDDGTIVWIIDAYTITDSFPLSATEGEINYMRNSVKVIVNAATGETSFYVWDDQDPLLRSWQLHFPTLYKSAAEIPYDIWAHLRFPEDLFDYQTNIYNTYHVATPSEFYNREDVWSTPTERTEQTGENKSMESYYNIVNLPGVTSSTPEFVLLRPVTPYSKDNMVALYVGRSDIPNSGQLLAYYLPKDRLTAGPSQIETRIDQNVELAKNFTLWNQEGSQVVRGGLYVLPVGDTLLYVKTIYLQARNNPIPELKVVVFVTEDQLVFGATAEEAFQKLVENKEKVKPEKKKNK